MERTALFLLRDCAGFNALGNYWNDSGVLRNGSFIWILFPYVVTCETDKVQVPIIGKYVDGIPYLKDFAASAAKQAPKYPAVQLTNICYQLHLLFHVSYWLSLFILHFQDGTEYDGLHLYSAQREHFQIQVH